MVMLENWRSVWISENKKYTHKISIKNEKLREYATEPMFVEKSLASLSKPFFFFFNLREMF